MENYIVDLILALIFVTLTVIYAVRGFAKTVLRSVAFVLAIILSKGFSGQITDFTVENTRLFAGMERALIKPFIVLITFVLLMVIFAIIIKIVDKIFKIPVLKQANRLLGGLLGAANGIILVLILSIGLQLSSHLVYNAKYINAVEYSVIVQHLAPNDKFTPGILINNGGK